jgi:cytochrome c-type biogenesis protein CcmH
MTRRRPPLGGRLAYSVLALLAVVALAVGSRHHAAPSNAARIANLEGLIKCPDCADLTIAQSSSAAAAGLRNTVVAMVDAGQSDAAIEQYVVGKYGPAEITAPRGGSGAVAVAVPAVAFGLGALALGVMFVRRRGQRGSADAVVDEADLALVTSALADRRGSP